MVICTNNDTEGFSCEISNNFCYRDKDQKGWANTSYLVTFSKDGACTIEDSSKELVINKNGLVDIKNSKPVGTLDNYRYFTKEKNEGRIKVLQATLADMADNCKDNGAHSGTKKEVIKTIREAVQKADYLLKKGYYDFAKDIIEDVYNNIDKNAEEVKGFEGHTAKRALSFFTKPIAKAAASLAPDSNTAKYGVVRTNTANHVVTFKKQFEQFLEIEKPEDSSTKGVELKNF